MRGIIQEDVPQLKEASLKVTFSSKKIILSENKKWGVSFLKKQFLLKGK